jgi:hypothetical protein
MKDPINKPKIGLGLEPLEVATVFAGLVVVFGLYLESGPDWTKSAKRHVWPERPVTGTALVALGVFAEVAIGLFIARRAKRTQLEAEQRISLAERATADANERAAQAQREAEEARLKAKELERRMGPLRPNEQFAEILRKVPPGKIEIWYSPSTREPWVFAHQLTHSLAQLGWTITSLVEIPSAEQRRSRGITGIDDSPKAPLYTLLLPDGATIGDDDSMARAFPRAMSIGLDGISGSIVGVVTGSVIVDLHILSIGER